MSSDKKRSSTLVKGQRLKLRIASLAPGGDGVSKDEGIPVFISRVAPGDLVEVELFDVRKDFARAQVLSIIEPSSVRSEPPCPLFKVCGGCQWQHMSYAGQLDAKTDIVKQALRHIGGQEGAPIAPTLAAENPLFYRNKVQFPVKNPQGSERILAGYYQQDSHKLVNIKHCPVQPEPLDRMLESVKNALERHHIVAYDESTGKGAIRHINARISHATQEVLVTLVVNPSSLSKKPFLERGLGKALKVAADEILEEVPEVVGVCVNLNEKVGNRILGDETLCLAGRDYIEEVLSTKRSDFPERLKQGLRFRLSSTSFFQVNTEQAIRILELVTDSIFAARTELFPDREPIIVDAYAGVGAISLWLGTFAERVIAVEDHDQAVKDGVFNNELNGMENVQFKPGRVETVVPELVAQGLQPDVVVLDPPRKGVSPEGLRAIMELAAPLVVYISCNPVTLARDLKVLAQGVKLEEGEHKGQVIGYKTKQIQPVDLFPQTYHVESITTLERILTDGAVGNMETA